MAGCGSDSECDYSRVLSTLVLSGDCELELNVSRDRVIFTHWESGEQELKRTITLTLQRRGDATTSSSQDVAVPISITPPSTARFELSPCGPPTSLSAYACLLRAGVPVVYATMFRLPVVSESDYAWDNFQDQVVIHTRLSKLVVHLQAWRSDVPVKCDGEEVRASDAMFPAALPTVKTPSFKLFHEIEVGAQLRELQLPQTGSGEGAPLNEEKVMQPKTPSNAGMMPDSPTLQTGDLSSLPSSRSSPREPSPRDATHPDRSLCSDAGVQPRRSLVTELQSLREAHEVITRLRSRRAGQVSKVSRRIAPSTEIQEASTSPETVALDAGAKAELEQFNHLVMAAKERAASEAAKAKSELAFYQQLLPKPPPLASTHGQEKATTSVEAAEHTKAAEVEATRLRTAPRKTRQRSAVNKRSSRLPALVSSASTNSVAKEIVHEFERAPSTTNQELSPAKLSGQTSRRQTSASCLRRPRPMTLKSLQPSRAKQQRAADWQALDDFDDPDPEVDEAPVFPDDLSGVATLEEEEPCC